MPWKPAALSDLEREKHQLQMAVLKLRRELETKQQYAGRLEVLLHQRTETIDALNGKLEQSREQVRRLDLQNGVLAAMLVAPQVDAKGEAVFDRGEL